MFTTTCFSFDFSTTLYYIMITNKPTQIDPDLTICSGLLHKIKSIIEEQFSVTLVGSFIICSKPNNCIILVNDIPSELLFFFHTYIKVT